MYNLSHTSNNKKTPSLPFTNNGFFRKFDFLKCWQYSLLMILMAWTCHSHAFIYPYDFGSYARQPRSIVNNAALLFACNQSPTFAGRLRTNRFTPEGLRTDDKPSLPTDDTAIEAEIGLCHHLLDWVSLGFFSAISSYDINETTKSLNNPLVFPFHKTYLPVISGAISIEPIDNFHFGFAAQFFETLKIDINLILLEELQATINTRIGAAANWNLGSAVETPFGVFHVGYQPAFEADLDVPITVPLDLSELTPLLPLDFTFDILQLDGALDYRPALWQLGWIGLFKNGIQAEAGVIINKWEDLGAEFFLRPQDPFGALDVFITDRTIILKNTVNPYMTLNFPLSDQFTIKTGLAAYRSPLVQQPERQAAVSGDVLTVKTGLVFNTKVFEIPMAMEGHLIYGHMKEQTVSGDGTVSGEFITFMSQLSFPL